MVMYINAEPYNFPFDEDLTPENTALIIIDMQIDFCRPGGYTAARGLDVSRNKSVALFQW